MWYIIISRFGEGMMYAVLTFICKPHIMCKDVWRCEVIVLYRWGKKYKSMVQHMGIGRSRSTLHMGKNNTISIIQRMRRLAYAY